MSDYLWDKSGPPDPDVERLEKTLATLRYRGQAPAPRRIPLRVRWLAVAAMLIVGAAGISSRS